MLEPLIQAIRDSVQVAKVEMSGVEYFSAAGNVLLPPLEPDPDLLTVSTLEAFVHALAFVPDDLFIHVTPQQVSAFSQHLAGRRDLQRFEYVRAVSPHSYRHESAWMTQELFLITLLTKFAPSDYRDYLVRFVSSLVSETRIVFGDDGITPTVQTRKGIRQLEDQAIRPIGELRPWRTFPEVEQPRSKYLLRIRPSEGKDPLMLSLQYVEDQSWRIEANQAIVRCLDTMTAYPIVA